MSAMAGTGSTLVMLVVPTVATTAIGLKPSARSAAIAASSSSGRMRNSASAFTRTTFSAPIPRVMAALSMLLCAHSEQYTRMRGMSRPASPNRRTSSDASASRAAASA